MCGIAGYFKPGGQYATGTVKQVLDRLCHRGPDQQRIWGDCSIEMGHARLSVLDLSDNASQPMTDRDTGNTIVFNGEIYNFKELRGRLQGRGYSFKSSGDTEVLLKLYCEFGEDCVPMLRGMFAFAIWDERRKRLLIARDRLGKKPFCYAELGSGFAFASEVRALAAHPSVSRDIDLEAMDIFLSSGSIPPPYSIYTSIRKLPAAHYGIVDAGGMTLKRYWSIDFRKKIQCSEQEALDNIQSRLEEAIRLRLESDVPLGALLSGGVDSSLVVALMAKASQTSFDTFTIGFNERKYDESGHAAKVASHLGVRHHVEVLRPAGFEEMLPEVIRQYGEPFSDDATLASMLLSKSTRRHVTVAFSGDGGDELACGYSSYMHVKLATALGEVVKYGPLSDRMAARIFGEPSIVGSVLRCIFSRVYPEYKFLFRALCTAKQQNSMVYNESTRQKVAVKSFEWFLKLSQKSYDHADNPVERLLWMDIVHCLADALLVKTDIASMAYGLEVRSPLLDHKLMEYMAALPCRMKIKGGTAKYLLKKLAAKFLPKEILYRRKQGFSMPVGQWTQGDSAPFTREAISQATPFLKRYFDMNALNLKMEEHLSGRKKHKKFVWNMLNLALWSVEHGHGRC